MKKLFTILAISLMLPFAMILTACGGGNPPDEPGGDETPENCLVAPTDKQYGAHFMDFLPADATTYTPTEGNWLYLEPGVEYSIWLANYIEKDSLTFDIFAEDEYSNGDRVEWTPINVPNYDNRAINTDLTKVGTFVVPSYVTGRYSLKPMHEQTTITLNFAKDTTFTQSQLDILNDYKFSYEDDQTRLSAVKDGFVVETSYGAIFKNNNYGGESVECSKNYGYYKDLTFTSDVQGLEVALEYSPVLSYKNRFYLRFLNPGASLSKTINLSINKSSIGVSTLKLNSHGLAGIVSATAMSWSPNFSQDVVLTLEPYSNINFANTTITINDTEVTPVYNQTKEKYEITIPAGKLPIEYISSYYDYIGDTERYNASVVDYDIVIEGINPQAYNMHTVKAGQEHNTSYSLPVGDFYYWDLPTEGDTDYNYYYKHNQDVDFMFVVPAEVPSTLTLKINGATYDVSSYLTYDSGVVDNIGRQIYNITVGEFSVEFTTMFRDDGEGGHVCYAMGVSLSISTDLVISLY